MNPCGATSQLVRRGDQTLQPGEPSILECRTSGGHPRSEPPAIVPKAEHKFGLERLRTVLGIAVTSAVVPLRGQGWLLSRTDSVLSSDSAVTHLPTALAPRHTAVPPLAVSSAGRWLDYK